MVKIEVPRQTLLKLFYWACLIGQIWTAWRSLPLSHLSHPILLWPVAWAEGLPFFPVWVCIVSVALGSTLLVACGLRSRWLRAFQVLAFFLFVALLNSHGKIRHGIYPMLWIDAILLGSTLGSLTERAVEENRLVFRAAQAYLLLTYSLSGFWKVLFFAQAWLKGSQHQFDMKSPAAEIAAILGRNSIESLWGGWFIAHVEVTLLFYVLTIALQITSLGAWFFPRSLRYWGLSLIVFHTFTYLILRIHFEQEALLALLFLVLPDARELTAGAGACPDQSPKNGHQS